MKFSITIPAYKRNFLKEAIDSCLAQTFTDFELVIVNDASPEGLDSIVHLYTDSRIRYYVNKQNCGAANVVDNWNICLNYSQGQYVICMGDDDMLMPHCLEEYAKLIEKYPGLGIYHAWTVIIDEAGKPYRMQHARPEWEGPASLAWHRWNGRTKQFIGDFCFDTERLKSDGGFYNIKFAWGSDDITAVRAAMKGGIAHTVIPCFMYRENQYTITRTGHYREKLLSTQKEREWYLNNLNYSPENLVIPSLLVQKRNSILYAERIYWESLQCECEKHFNDKIGGTLIAEFMEKPMGFFLWLKNAKAINLRKSIIIKSWFYAMIKKMANILWGHK